MRDDGDAAAASPAPPHPAPMAIVVRLASGAVETVESPGQLCLYPERRGAAAPPLERLPDEVLAVVLGRLGLRDVVALAAVSPAMTAAVARTRECERRTGRPLAWARLLDAAARLWGDVVWAMGRGAAGTLRGPAGRRNVGRAEAAVGRPLPREVVASALVHDGQHLGAPSRGGAGTGAVRILPLREMAAAYCAEALPGGAWLPVAARQGAQIAAVSLDTGAVHVLEGRGASARPSGPVARSFFGFVRAAYR